MWNRPSFFQELPFSGTIDVGTAVHQTSPTRCESCQTWNTSRPRPCHLWVGWTGLRCPGTFFLAFHLLGSISPGQWWHRRGKKFQGWALTRRQRSLISCLSFDEPRKSWQNLTHGDPSFNQVEFFDISIETGAQDIHPGSLVDCGKTLRR